MNTLHTINIAIVATCCSIALAGPVVDLEPGAFTDSLSGIANTEMGELIGSVESDTLQNFTIYANDKSEAVLYEGTLMTRIVRSFQTGQLHFNYRLLNPNSQFTGVISNIDVSGYTGFQTRVEFRDELGGEGTEGPTFAERSLDGDVINFDFKGMLDTAEESRFFFAMVDSTNWYANSATATIHLTTGESATLSVAGAVPAPGALGLFAVGGLMTMRRRR